MSEDAFACLTHTHTHTNRAASCRLVRLMLLLCVPVGSGNRLGTCLDSSLRQDFIGCKGRLGSLWSAVNGSAYQILLSSTSLATLTLSLFLMLKQQGTSKLDQSPNSLLPIEPVDTQKTLILLFISLTVKIYLP